VLNLVHTLWSKIQKRYLRSLELSSFALSENVEDRAKWPLASTYVLYLYRLYGSYIFGLETGDLEGKRLPEGSKVYHYWYQRGASFNWFSGWLPQYKLLDYILVSILRVAIWNVTAKWVILITGDLLYVKSTHSKDMSSWWCCHYNIYKTSLSFMTAILLATYFHGSDATIQISSLPWWEYSYQTQFSIAEFFYLTVSVSPLKPLLRAIH